MLKFSLLLILFVHGETVFAEKNIPSPPRNYVYDEARLLDTSIDTLSSILSQEDRQFGNQILVAIFNSLDGEDPVDYTNRVFTSWHPGEKDKNNGALLAIYLKERKMRIEVGYGLEPLLTDAKSKGIMIDILGPAFKEKKYSEGVIGSVQEIQRIIHSEQNELPEKHIRQKVFHPINLIFVTLFFVLIYFLDGILPKTLGSGIRRSRHSGGWSGGSGGFGGGGFGGSSSGGSGGFSGGGGMSGGGGATGDW